MTDRSNRPTDHLFVRHPDPHFGITLGGGCAQVADGIMCGWPERFHPDLVEHHLDTEAAEAAQTN